MLPNACQIHAILGFPSDKRFNLEYLDDEKTLLSCTGNSFQLLDMNTLEKKIVLGKNKRGIGATAVHPKLPLFAVAEKGEDPEILIYSYPDLKIKHRLKNGTERTFSDIQFNNSGDQLASVGNAPDYLLTVWDWEKEVITLHTKAFSQEVYRVCFSPYSEGRLCTSGMGHIRFWKMAKTFTGLKLQGAIGKFGNVDISDVSAFVELKDGRIVSGSEDGYLIMWEGHFIQFQLAQKDHKPCHAGPIEFVTLEDRELISAGSDGYIRTWDLGKFEFAEVSEEDPVVCLDPEKEIQMPGASVKGMLRGKDHWLIQDSNGAIHRLSLPEYKLETLLRFHAGSITGAIPSRNSHFTITCGQDGSIRCWDLLSRKELYRKDFNEPCSSIIWVPNVVAGSKNRVLLGFKDGVIRQLERKNSSFELVQVCKPHYTEVSCMAVSPNGAILATAATDGTVFFIDIKQSYAPIGFVKLEDGKAASCISWHKDSKALLVAVGSKLIEFICPQLGDFPDDSERKTYKIECKKRVITLDVPNVNEAPPVSSREEVKEGEKTEEVEEVQEVKVTLHPDEISFSSYMDDGKILVCLQPPDFEGLKKSSQGFTLDPKYSRVYTCTFEELQARGEGEEKDPQLADVDVAKHTLYIDAGSEFGVLSIVDKSLSGKYILIGSHSGKVQIRPADALEKSVMFATHDGDEGEISGVCLSFDDRILSSVGKDGNFFVFNLDVEKAIQGGEDSTKVELPSGVEEKLLEAKKDVDDITDPKFYSFEEAKQKKELDDKRTEAEKKKDRVRLKIKQLQKEFKDIQLANAALPTSERLDPAHFEIDPELMKSLRDAVEAKVQQVRADLEYETEKIRYQLEKLKKKFYMNLLVEHIRLYSFTGELVVSSFRVKKQTDERLKLIEEIHQVLSGELIRQKGESQRLTLPPNVPGALEYKPGQPPKDYSSQLVTVKSPKGRKKISGAEKKKLVAERSRELRALREKDLKWLEDNKPDSSKENPEDRKLIAYARANLGDFKLKSAPDYHVPESQRVNTEKKRKQILLLTDSVQSVKMQYNRKFLALRDLKKAICDRMKKESVELQAINMKLGIEEEVIAPTMAQDEWPEKRGEVTDEDIAEFEVILKAREKAKRGKNAGFGGGEDDDEDDADIDQKSDTKVSKEKNSQRNENDPRRIAAERYQKRISAVAKSDLEKRKLRVKRLILQRRRMVIKENMREATNAFDKALRTLAVEKVRLDADLKATDLRLLTLAEELTLLQKFEATENSMLDLRKKAVDSIASLQKEQKDCRRMLEEKKEQAVKCQALLQKYQAQFDELMANYFKGGAGAPIQAQLSRIYNKKVKRKRPRNEDEEENSDSESESEEDSEDADQCPMDCPTDIYDKILDMRERKADSEEEMAGILKARQDIEAKFKSLDLKVATVQKDLSKCERDLEEFQSKKQKALNKIQLNVPLRLSQIRFLENGSMPPDITKGLILTAEQKGKLAENLVKVEHEGEQLKAKYAHLDKQGKVLRVDLKKKQQQIENEIAKCEDVQALKFGRKIDLNILRQKTSLDVLDEMKRKLAMNEEQFHMTLNDLELKILQARESLSETMQKNTYGLEKIEILRRTQLDLEEALNNTAKKINVDSESGSERVLREKDEIIKLVKMQESEISALKAEINVLGRKGGDIFSTQR